jgi:hypothetical protein
MAHHSALYAATTQGRQHAITSKIDAALPVLLHHTHSDSLGILVQEPNCLEKR